jgi:WD40 repeat protein
MRIASNGRYLVAPTAVGKVYIWNIRTKQLVGILEDHNQDVRDILFYPGRQILLTCADGKYLG